MRTLFTSELAMMCTKAKRSRTRDSEQAFTSSPIFRPVLNTSFSGCFLKERLSTCVGVGQEKITDHLLTDAAISLTDYVFWPAGTIGKPAPTLLPGDSSIFHFPVFILIFLQSSFIHSVIFVEEMSEMKTVPPEAVAQLSEKMDFEEIPVKESRESDVFIDSLLDQLDQTWKFAE
jgi:hypothetical protein